MSEIFFALKKYTLDMGCIERNSSYSLPQETRTQPSSRRIPQTCNLNSYCVTEKGKEQLVTPVEKICVIYFVH